MRSRIDDADVRGAILRHACRWGVSGLTFATTIAIPAGAPHMQVLSRGTSSGNVTLPASPKKGDFFFIINAGTGTSVLTIQDSAGSALVPACTPAISEIAFVTYDGTKWWNFVALGS